MRPQLEVQANLLKTACTLNLKEQASEAFEHWLDVFSAEITTTHSVITKKALA